MFEDFEFDPVILGWSGIFWLIVIAMLWKFQLGEGWPLWMKIVLTVTSLPVVYLVIMAQANRD